MKDEILKKFCSEEKIRPAMMNPFINGEFVCATNGHIGIIIPKSLTETDYSKNPTMRMIEVLDNTDLLTKSLNIQLRETMTNFPKEPIYETIGEEKKCPECDGSGEIECSECGNTYDCKRCDGTGKIGHIIKTDKIIGEQIAEDYRVKINGCYFNPAYINLIADIADGWNILALSDRQASLWQSGDIRMLLMPIRYDEADGLYKVIEIKTT
jgi:hypothetical protein